VPRISGRVVKAVMMNFPGSYLAEPPFADERTIE
jgi:hypothetical protein